jgi:hypothetical protein
MRPMFRLPIVDPTQFAAVRRSELRWEACKGAIAQLGYLAVCSVSMFMRKPASRCLSAKSLSVRMVAFKNIIQFREAQSQ